MCRFCRQEYDRERYQRLNEKRRQQIGDGDRRRKLAVAQYIHHYQETHPCVDCGEADPVVLEFDHVRGEKIGNVGAMRAKHSLKVIMKEIEKCEVRCANCHRRKTARQFGYHAWMTDV